MTVSGSLDVMRRTSALRPGSPLTITGCPLARGAKANSGRSRRSSAFSRARIGSMAAEAVGDEDRTDVLVEGDGVREGRHRHRGRRGRRVGLAPGHERRRRRGDEGHRQDRREQQDPRASHGVLRRIVVPAAGGARPHGVMCSSFRALPQDRQTWRRHPGAADIEPSQARQSLQRRKPRVRHRGAVETERLEVVERGERLQAGVPHGRPAQVEMFQVRHLAQHLQARVGDPRPREVEPDQIVPRRRQLLAARHPRRPRRRPPPCTRGHAPQAGSPAAIREPPPARPRAWSRTRRPGDAEAPRPPAAPPPEGSSRTRRGSRLAPSMSGACPLREHRPRPTRSARPTRRRSAAAVPSAACASCRRGGDAAASRARSEREPPRSRQAPTDRQPGLPRTCPASGRP